MNVIATINIDAIWWLNNVPDEEIPPVGDLRIKKKKEFYNVFIKNKKEEKLQSNDYRQLSITIDSFITVKNK